MTELLKELQQRSNSTCELCQSTNSLDIYEVPDSPSDVRNTQILVCSTCSAQLADSSFIQVDHWRCLNDAIWNPEPAVQVVAYRILDKIKSENWPLDLMNTMYMEEETKQWALNGIVDVNAIVHRDSNGNVLSKGDSIVLIKDLDVKGANFTAKRGTAVRNISLAHDNVNHIEGRVNGQQIVILTQYVKKS